MKMTVNETSTIVMPEVLSDYLTARTEIADSLQRGENPGPERLQDWIYVGLQSMATLGATKNELLPIFRGMQVFAMASDAGSGFRELHRTLAQLDAQLGSQKGGFSRLLENALEAGSIDLPDAIDLQNLPQDVQANYRGVQDINLRLQAIDQLSHALQQPADLPACALVLNGLIADLPNCSPEQRASAMEHLSAWAELRQLPSAIPALLAHGSTVAEPSQLTADGPPEPPLLAPFLMWFLAENRPQIAENKPWNETLNGIMMGAGFPPLSVLIQANW